MFATIVTEEKKTEFAQNLSKAVRENDAEAAEKAFREYFEQVEQDIIRQAKDFDAANADKVVLANRGLRVLSNAEEKYFKGFIEAAKSVDAVKALTDFSEVLPDTEINAIFEDMQQAHPLLTAVQFTDTAALTKFIFDAAEAQMAVWGELTSAVTEEIEGSVELVPLMLNKLTAFMLLSNDMLDLGPVWVEKYTRTCLAEALAAGAEDGIVNGSGVKGQPIGMKRKIAKGTDVNSETGYPEKTAVKVTDFSPASYGALLAQMAKTEAGKPRSFYKVDLIVNPVDYFKLIMPATTLLTPSGTYAHDLYPFPTNVITSNAVASGKALLGIEKKYFFGIGVGTGKGKIEKSTDFKFLEDVSTYKIKLYGNGRARDDNAFQYLDISEVKPLAYGVLAVTESAESSAASDAEG